MTTVSLPMVYDSIPFSGKKSYLFNDKIEEKNILEKQIATPLPKNSRLGKNKA